MKAASKENRTVSSTTMESAMKYVPRDGFRLDDALINKVYYNVGVQEYKVTDSINSFTVTLESEDGKVITLSASALKRSRVLRKTDVGPTKLFEKCKYIALRSNMEEVMDGSSYFHSFFKMSKGEEFEVPAKLRLVYAILFEDRSNGKPMLSPYQYMGFRKLVAEYGKTGRYPSMDDFREELLKTGKDRLECLPVDVFEPKEYAWVKMEPGDFRHILIWEAVK